MTSRSDQTPAHRVAVIIPCQNDGATVRETVESVRAQEPCEIVVVDDGSDDPATATVLEQLSAGGIRVVRQENQGLSAARMAGVRATSAPYVFPLDADDLVAPGALARLANALDADPKAWLAWGDEETFGSTSSYRRAAQTLDPWRITYLNEIPNALIRREAILQVHGWQLRDGYEDWDLWMSFAERGWNGVYLPGVMLRYRVHGQRMLTSTSIPRHERICADLRRRHTLLFARRRANWRRSPASWRLKILLPAISSLPFLSARWKHRLHDLVGDPRRLIGLRLRRLRRGPTRPAIDSRAPL